MNHLQGNMSNNLRQRVLTLGLGLLLLGPSFAKLFHSHETGHTGYCHHEGESHIHLLDTTAECAICFFSFSAYELEECAPPLSQKLRKWGDNLIRFSTEILTTTLSFQGVPRAPPT